MAEIDYFAIEEAVSAILLADVLTAEVNDEQLTVVIEENFNPKPDTCPWVGIYLDNWSTPAEQELIAPGSGSAHVTFLTFELWLYEYALDNKDSSTKRDTLLAKVKEVLKKVTNRDLNNTVLHTTFGGGRFENQKTETKGQKRGAFYKGVSLKLIAEVRE